MTERADPELAELYIHLYFDEDVPLGIVRNLRTRGYDVLSTQESQMLNKSDDEHLLYAVSQRRAIVTHNRIDFEERHRRFLETGLKHYGVIIAKRRREDTEVVARLLKLLDSITAEEMENQLRYI